MPGTDEIGGRTWESMCLERRIKRPASRFDSIGRPPSRTIPHSARRLREKATEKIERAKMEGGRKPARDAAGIADRRRHGVPRRQIGRMLAKWRNRPAGQDDVFVNFRHGECRVAGDCSQAPSHGRKRVACREFPRPAGLEGRAGGSDATFSTGSGPTAMGLCGSPRDGGSRSVITPIIVGKSQHPPAWRT